MAGNSEKGVSREAHLSSTDAAAARRVGPQGKPSPVKPELDATTLSTPASIPTGENPALRLPTRGPTDGTPAPADTHLKENVASLVPDGEITVPLRAETVLVSEAGSQVTPGDPVASDDGKLIVIQARSEDATPQDAGAADMPEASGRDLHPEEQPDVPPSAAGANPPFPPRNNETTFPGEEPHEDASHIQPILMAAVARFNEREESMGIRGVTVYHNAEFDLGIVDNGVNNQLTVVVTHTYADSKNEAHVGIGHYDPGRGEFFIYPEFFSENEAKRIKELAPVRRAQAIQRSSFLDYDDDVIRDLRRKHRDVLLEDGLIYTIINKYQKLPPEEKVMASEFIIDDCTSFYVSLAPRLGGYIESYPASVQAEGLFHGEEAFVTIAFEGVLLRDRSGRLTRGSGSLIIGSRDRNNPQGRFVPNRRLVTDKEFARVLALTDELRVLRATSYPNLNVEAVALNLE